MHYVDVLTSYVYLFVHACAADEMMQPWDERGCHQRNGPKQFTTCAKCGHEKIMWFEKGAIEAKNKVLKKNYDKEMVQYNAKTMAGKKPKTKPSLKQDPLLIRCCCSQNCAAVYGGTCTNL